MDKIVNLLMKIDRDMLVSVGVGKMPDTIKFKRENIFLIILGYVFAVIAGVTGVSGIHDIVYSLMGYLYMGWVFCLVSVIEVMMIYGALHWCFAYISGKELTPDGEGPLYFEHYKYDRFTRVNGACMLVVFIITVLWYANELNW